MAKSNKEARELEKEVAHEYKYAIKALGWGKEDGLQTSWRVSVPVDQKTPAGESILAIVHGAGVEFMLVPRTSYSHLFEDWVLYRNGEELARGRAEHVIDGALGQWDLDIFEEIIEAPNLERFFRSVQFGFVCRIYYEHMGDTRKDKQSKEETRKLLRAFQNFDQYVNDLPKKAKKAWRSESVLRPSFFNHSVGLGVIALFYASWVGFISYNNNLGFSGSIVIFLALLTIVSITDYWGRYFSWRKFLKEKDEQLYSVSDSENKSPAFENDSSLKESEQS